MAADPTQRALRLLSLLSSRRSWSGAELAEHLGVTDRTLRRDVDRLRSLGYGVEGTTGTTGGYRLGTGRDVPPLFLDDDEAVAVTAALLTAAADRSTGMVDSSARALAKLSHVLPPASFRRVAAVQAATTTVRRTDTPAVDPEVIATLAEAARDHLGVRFAYVDRDGRPTERRVEPHGLATPGRVWYLIAFDLDRDDWRLFRVDRIRRAAVTGHGAPARALPVGGPAAFLARGIARAPMRHTATVAVPMGVDELAARRPELLRARLAPDPDAADGPLGACLVRLGADDPDDLVAQVLDVLHAAGGGRLAADASAVVRERVGEAARRLARSLEALPR